MNSLSRTGAFVLQVSFHCREFILFNLITLNCVWKSAKRKDNNKSGRTRISKTAKSCHQCNISNLAPLHMVQPVWLLYPSLFPSNNLLALLCYCQIKSILSQRSFLFIITPRPCLHPFSVASRSGAMATAEHYFPSDLSLFPTRSRLWLIKWSSRFPAASSHLLPFHPQHKRQPAPLLDSLLLLILRLSYFLPLWFPFSLLTCLNREFLPPPLFSLSHFSLSLSWLPLRSSG